MKTLACLSIGFLSLGLNSALASDQPRGSLLELHSCELYAGGCLVSSEEPMDGRYMLHAWNFTGGTFSDTALSGLQLALLQSSTENLAADHTKSDQAVVYLPQTATASQRQALLAWLKSSLPDLKSTRLQTRVVPLQFAKTATGYSFSAGDIISLKTASLESCDTGGCGESLWYTPRAPTTVFTVGVARSYRVTEPMLKLEWDDARKRSIFLAKFGETASAKNLFVTAADLCGPADKLF